MAPTLSVKSHLKGPGTVLAKKAQITERGFNEKGRCNPIAQLDAFDCITSIARIVRQGLLESSLMTTFGRVSYCCLLDKSRRAAHVLVEIKRFVYCTCICKSVFVLVEIKRWSSQTVDRMWFHATWLWRCFVTSSDVTIVTIVTSHVM